MSIRSFAMTAVLSLVSPVLACEASADTSAPFVIAHRSAEIGAPENSLAWIDAAIAAGADMVHLNAQQTADDHYVLMHDGTMNRTTDVETVFPEGAPGGPTREARWGKDYVRDYRLTDIARLHLEDGSAVPTLEAALDAAQDRVAVLLGLKIYEPDSLAAVFEGRDRDDVVLFDLYVSTTDQSKLRGLAEATGLHVAVSLYQTRDALADLNRAAEELGPVLSMVNVSSRRITPEVVARAGELGLQVIVSGWNGPEDLAIQDGDTAPWRAAFDSGFAAMTDQPAAVAAALAD